MHIIDWWFDWQGNQASQGWWTELLGSLGSLDQPGEKRDERRASMQGGGQAKAKSESAKCLDC
jgi:hypothetical protein